MFGSSTLAHDKLYLLQQTCFLKFNFLTTWELPCFRIQSVPFLPHNKTVIIKNCQVFLTLELSLISHKRQGYNNWQFVLVTLSFYWQSYIAKGFNAILINEWILTGNGTLVFKSVLRTFKLQAINNKTSEFRKCHCSRFEINICFAVHNILKAFKGIKNYVKKLFWHFHFLAQTLFAWQFWSCYFRTSPLLDIKQSIELYRLTKYRRTFLLHFWFLRLTNFVFPLRMSVNSLVITKIIWN